MSSAARYPYYFHPGSHSGCISLYTIPMKPLLALLLLATTLSAQTATRPALSACPDRSDMQEEITETRAQLARMQNRIQTMRNAAGTVSDFEVRNALQVNADAWQDFLDSLKKRIDHLQASVDRCEAREKIQGTTAK